MIKVARVVEVIRLSEEIRVLGVVEVFRVFEAIRVVGEDRC